MDANSPQQDQVNLAELPYASFLQRAGATLLDTSITLTIQCLFAFLILRFGANYLFFLPMILLPAIYKIYFESEYGATLGKIWLRMKILNTSGEDITIVQALNRYAIYFAYDFALMYAAFQFMIIEGQLCEDIVQMISFQCLQTDVTGWASTAVFVSMVWVAFDARKQAFHDKIAKTIVIKDKAKKIMESWVIGAVIWLIALSIWLMTQISPELMNQSGSSL